MSQNKRWVLLENSEPHTVLLNHDEAIELMVKWQVMFPLIKYELFYDEYYEYIDYYSEEEKEQINRLIP
jgi:hypothetical protein